MRFLRVGRIVCLGMVFCLSCTTISAKYKAQPRYVGTDRLTSAINRIVQNTDPSARIGIIIKSMKYGDTLYTKSEQRPFIPASTLKILTAEAALLYLGTDFKFQTRVLTDAKTIDNGVLDGNLYLVHSGDPSLTYYDLTDLIAELKSRRIQQITGNVYVDNNAYDQVNWGPGWLWDDKKSCYGAPINASIINHNCMSFTVKPGKAPGNAAYVASNIPFSTPIKNQVVTKPKRSRSCYLRLHDSENDILSISGCMPKGNYTWGVSSVVTNMVQYNKLLLQSLFKRFGISIQGSIKPGSAPLHSATIAIHESKPLAHLINTMLKNSDNVIAGSLLKKMGQLFSHRPGSWESGSNAVSRILAQKAFVDTGRLSIIDGSGLSRYNQVTPKQMMQVLEFAYHNYSTNTEFMSALPISGVDGTLKHRMRNIFRKVRAKTGTMSGVVSLAGYTVNADKEPIAFVIMVNGRDGYDWKYREMEDAIVTALTRYSRD